MDELRIEVHHSLDDLQLLEIQNLLNYCAEVDGINPFSEHAILHMQYGKETHVQHFSCFEKKKLVAYGHVDLSDQVSGPNIEVAVNPEYRRHGVGKKLIEKLVENLESRPIRLWAHGLNTGAAALAKSCGFTQVRTLWQMRRSLIKPIPNPQFPNDITLKIFNMNTDTSSWLECNRISFADHPEQGQWTEESLHQRFSENWFNPNGLKVATFEEKIVGYVWTKVDAANADAKLGEIYVVGVLPEWQSKGLGKALTLEGLRNLRSQNLNSALLYVDEQNQRAISLYESIGFSHWDTDTLFQLD